MSKITAYCHVTKESAFLNGDLLLTRNFDSEDKFPKQLYKVLNISYPKFYKMDQLAQTGFLAFEILRHENRFPGEYGEEEVALLFANKSSSTVTDLRFQDSYIENEAPSPSLFVYTLPNIVIGELAILNKWYGENMFAVLPNFAPAFYIGYSQMLFEDNAAKAVIGGWLEVTEEDTEVFMFLVEKDAEEGIEFTKEELHRLQANAKL